MAALVAGAMGGWGLRAESVIGRRVAAFGGSWFSRWFVLLGLVAVVGSGSVGGTRGAAALFAQSIDGAPARSAAFAEAPVGLRSAVSATLGAGESAQLVQQGAALTPTDEAGAGSFGWSMALSADGDTALISGPFDSTDAFGTSAGAVWVFVRTGSTWTQQGPKLAGSVGLFGNTVALSADGNTALIGSPDDNNRVGAALVFTRSGTTWTQQGPKLTASDEAGTSYFGVSVELSADGNTALIGGPTDSNNAGAAWIFTRSGSTWTQQGAKLTGAGEAGPGEFAYSGALSADGNTALLGGPTDDNGAGAAWIFTRSGSTWTERGAKLIPSDEMGAGEFGWSSALSGNGATALIGAPFDNSNAGAAWEFTQTGASWAQAGSKLLSGGASAGIEVYGVVTALTTDGDTALIGDANANTDTTYAVMLERSGSAWTREGSTIDGVHGDYLSVGAALSGDGTTVLIGGDRTNGNAGEVWAFDFSATAPDAPTTVNAAAGDGQAVVSFTPPASDGGAPVTSYTVTASPGGETATGLGSPITVSGLADGTSYTFTVTATNSAGTGPASSASGPVTPAAPFSAGGGGGGGDAIPDLKLTVGAPGQVAVGEQAMFSLGVFDLNGATATGVHLIVSLPAGAVVDFTTSDRGSGCNTGAVTGTLDCNLDFLSATLIAHVTVVLTLPAGKATLTAAVSDSQGDKNTADNTASATVQVGAVTTITTQPPPTRRPTTADHINGTAKADHLTGTAGADVIQAGAGNDWVYGGAGDDVIYGGPGNDILYGGPGADTIYGGPGNDTIHAADGVKDTIDCGPGHDVVYADRYDKVAKNCEVLARARA